MSSFLDSYSLDQACDEIAGLDIYSNPYDRFLFSRAAMKFLRNELRRESGIDLLSFIGEREIGEFCRLALSQHGRLDNDLAFIVVTTALKIEFNRVTSKPEGEGSA